MFSTCAVLFSVSNLATIHTYLSPLIPPGCMCMVLNTFQMIILSLLPFPYVDNGVNIIGELMVVKYVVIRDGLLTPQGFSLLGSSIETLCSATVQLSQKVAL